MTVVLNEVALVRLLESPAGPVGRKVQEIADGVEGAYKKRAEDVSARAVFTPDTFQSGFQNGLEIEVGFTKPNSRIQQKILREREKLLALIEPVMR